MFDFAIQQETTQTTHMSASTRSLAHAFIERLSRDDAFRAYTTSDPVAAVAQYGFTIDRSELPVEGITLPSKAVLREHLDVIARKFAEAAVPVVMFRI